MKNLIYQFWEGQPTSGNEAGVRLMKEYADRIGVEYVFELNPSWPENARIKRKNLGRYNPHYGAFKPIFDESYSKYDNILFCDTDVIPVDRCSDNIFEEFVDLDIELGVCEEWMQPELRSTYNMGGISTANDKRWHQIIQNTYNNKMPLDDKGRPRVFNSGCVMYRADGRKKAKEVFVDFKSYCSLMATSGLPAFYQGDQNYLGSMLPRFNWGLMDYKWNSQIFYQPGTTGDNRPISDYRKNPCFVHVQLRGADNYSMERLRKVVNDKF